MQASDISNELLNEILITEGPWTYREPCQALARAELDRRAITTAKEVQPVKVEEVRYWQSDAGVTAKTVNGIIAEHSTGMFVGTKLDMPEMWRELTAAEYEAKAEAVGEEIAYPSSTYGNEAKAGKADGGNCWICAQMLVGGSPCTLHKKPTPPAPVTVAGAGAARLLGVDLAPVNVVKIPQVYLRDAYETLEEFLDDMRVKLNETICAVNELNEGRGK